MRISFLKNIIFSPTFYFQSCIFNTLQSHYNNTVECVSNERKISVEFRIYVFARTKAIGPKIGERRAVEMDHAHK